MRVVDSHCGKQLEIGDELVEFPGEQHWRVVELMGSREGEFLGSGRMTKPCVVLEPVAPYFPKKAFPNEDGVLKGFWLWGREREN